MKIAYCYASGKICFGASMPKGALPIAKGRGKAKRMVATVTVLARHAYDGKTLLVPGVPEAENKNAAVDALLRFNAEVSRRLKPQGKRRAA